jgi:hypothetical protein
MGNNILKNIFFYDENDPPFLHKLNMLIILMYLLTTILFFIFGILALNLQTILAGVILTFWILFTICIFKIFHTYSYFIRNFRWIYIPAIFVLAVLEETIIYYNGGGLGGKAKSLEQDLLLAVPVFLGIGIGIYLLNHKRKLNPAEIFIIGAIQGILIEIIFPGNIGFVLIIGGGAMGIYGTMMACVSPKHENNIKSINKILIDLLVGTCICFIFVIIGAIIGDNLHTIFLE